MKCAIRIMEMEDVHVEGEIEDLILKAAKLASQKISEKQPTYPFYLIDLDNKILLYRDVVRLVESE